MRDGLRRHSVRPKTLGVATVLCFGALLACTRPVQEASKPDRHGSETVIRELARAPRFGLGDGQVLGLVAFPASDAKEPQEIAFVEGELVCKLALSVCGPLTELLPPSGGWPWVVEFVAYIAPSESQTKWIEGFRVVHRGTDPKGCESVDPALVVQGAVPTVTPISRYQAFQEIQWRVESLPEAHWVGRAIGLECRLEFGEISPANLEAELLALHSRRPRLTERLGLVGPVSSPTGDAIPQVASPLDFDLRDISLMPCWEGHGEIDRLGAALQAWESSEDGMAAALEGMRGLGLVRLAQAHEDRLTK